jgi:hypothetical protein
MIAETKIIPQPASFGRKIMYGTMGSAAAVASLLAGSCLSRCNGCMGCLAGGAGLVGILASAKMVEKFSGAGKKKILHEAGKEIKKNET